MQKYTNIALASYVATLALINASETEKITVKNDRTFAHVVTLYEEQMISIFRFRRV